MCVITGPLNSPQVNTRTHYYPTRSITYNNEINFTSDIMDSDGLPKLMQNIPYAISYGKFWKIIIILWFSIALNS